jgi:hypothetical protein
VNCKKRVGLEVEGANKKLQKPQQGQQARVSQKIFKTENLNIGSYNKVVYFDVNEKKRKKENLFSSFFALFVFSAVK